MRDLTVLSRLTIAQRIYGGFGTLIVLIGIVSVAGYLGVQALSGIFSEYRAAAAKSLAIADMVDDIAKLRLAGSKYRIQPNDEAAADFREAASTMTIGTKGAMGLFDGDKAALATQKLLQDERAAYVETFDRTVELEAARKALLAEMQAKAEAARAALGAVMTGASSNGQAAPVVEASAASEGVLLMLLRGERYLASGAEDDYGAIGSNGADASGHLKGLSQILGMFRPELAAKADEASSEVADYLALAAKLRDATVERYRLRSEDLDTVGPKMEQQLATLSQTIVDRQNRLGPEGEQKAVMTQSMIAAAAAIAMVAGLVMAVLMGRWLSRAIRSMAASMRRMADGDLDVEVAETDAGHELGQMAKALEVFRTNGKAVRQIDHERGAARRIDDERRALQDALQSEVEAVVTAAAAGDFSVRLHEDYGSDELNAFAGGMNHLLATVAGGLEETGQVLAALARADLTERMQGDYSGAFGRLRQDTNAAADKFTEIVGQLQGTSRSLRTATGEMLSGSNDLSARTTRQSAAIEETSASMEQLSSTISTNSARADAAAKKTLAASDLAEEGGLVMHQATDAMERITNSSSKISNIIGLIDDIAFQTNLLALNASVEAARAGEAGKGFAVVAVEVRRLAQSAAQASAEVKVLIEQSGTEVKGGSKLVASAAGKLEAILAAVRENTSLMGEISEATREQALAVTEVNNAIRQMDEMTQHNAALVEETNAAIEQTEAQAVELDRIVEIFTVPAEEHAPRRGQARAA